MFLVFHKIFRLLKDFHNIRRILGRRWTKKPQSNQHLFSILLFQFWARLARQGSWTTVAYKHGLIDCGQMHWLQCCNEQTAISWNSMEESMLADHWDITMTTAIWPSLCGTTSSWLSDCQVRHEVSHCSQSIPPSKETTLLVWPQ